MQFYTGDWLKDPAVRACSLAARGLWFEILCLMWESPERGVLKTGDAPWGATETASAVGADVTLVAKLLAELKSKGVASSRAEDGALYSRRMVRDEIERRKETDRQRRYRASGQSSADTQQDTYTDTHTNAHSVTGDVTPVSHGSSSSSSTTNRGLNFTGVLAATEESNQAKFDARHRETHARDSAEPQHFDPQLASPRPANSRLEELRLQAEILGRQERLRGKWPAANASAGVGTGPQPGAYGVRAKAGAIERARAREEKAS